MIKIKDEDHWFVGIQKKEGSEVKGLSVCEPLSHVWLCEPMDPWTVVHQAPLSLGPPSKNTGVGCLSLLQGIFLTQGSNPGLPHCGQILYHWATREALKILDPGLRTDPETSQLLNISHLKGVCIQPKTVSKKVLPRNSLAVLWSGLHTFTAKGLGSIPGWGTKITQAAWQGQKEVFKKSPSLLD